MGWLEYGMSGLCRLGGVAARAPVQLVAATYTGSGIAVGSVEAMVYVCNLRNWRSSQTSVPEALTDQSSAASALPTRPTSTTRTLPSPAPRTAARRCQHLPPVLPHTPCQTQPSSEQWAIVSSADKFTSAYASVQGQAASMGAEGAMMRGSEPTSLIPAFHGPSVGIMSAASSSSGASAASPVATFPASASHGLQGSPPQGTAQVLPESSAPPTAASAQPQGQSLRPSAKVSSVASNLDARISFLSKLGAPSRPQAVPELQPSNRGVTVRPAVRWGPGAAAEGTAASDSAWARSLVSASRRSCTQSHFSSWQL